MAAGLTEALAALLLKDAQLGATRFAVHDAEHAGVSHERRAREDVPGVTLDEQHLLEGELRADLAGGPVDLDNGPGRHLHLAATGLNNGVHSVPSVEMELTAGSTPARAKDLV